MLKKIIFYLSSIVFVILVIEICLRLSGSLISFDEYRYSRVKKEDERKYRILTLGESTTVRYEENGEDISWPGLLENRLKKNNKNVKIYNKGVSGTTTHHILKELPILLKKYRPNIVIALMGINDSQNLHYRKIDNFWMNLKVMKLYRWLIERLKIKKIVFMTDKEMIICNQLIRKLLDQKNYDLAEINKSLEQILHVEDFLVYLFWQTFSNNPKNPSKKDMALSKYIAELALEKISNSARVINIFLGHAMLSRNYKLCRKVGFDFLNEGNRLTAEGSSRLAHCLETEKDYDTFKSFYPYIEYNSSLEYNPHKELYKILEEERIPLVVLGYPRQSLFQLKQEFSKLKNVDFVENFRNFNQALKIHKFNDLFRDRFAGEWGHATKQGNLIIVDELYPLILNKVDKK